MNFSDLRAILQYVPQFRGRVFVVALDGAVIDSPDFSNILLDLAVLRSLSIRVVLVHGASAQIAALGRRREVALSNTDGTGVTDEATMEVSMDAISRLGSAMMQSLTTVKMRAATANAVLVHPAGVIDGVDAGFTGTVERVDAGALRGFLDQDILPVVPPLGFDSDGQTLRVNSDAVAREVAVALEASKILFLSRDDPAEAAGGGMRQWSAEEAARFVKEHPGLPPGTASKLRHGARATREGIPRVHLVGSGSEDALLAELFSNEGVGLMIYSDDYRKLRPAARSDAEELHMLIHHAVEDGQLMERSREEILRSIADYTVLEVDGNVVGCAALHHHAGDELAELACLFVKRGHTGQGYGAALVEGSLQKARSLGARRIFALSTQASGYLQRAGFTRSEDLSLLPPARREKSERSGRNPHLLLLDLEGA